MATGGGQDLPSLLLLLLLLLLRPCEASAGRPAGPAAGGNRRPVRPRDPAPGAALSPQVSGREPACPRSCGGRCPAEPPRCAPGVPAVLDGCSCCLVCARQRGERCSALLPCDESSGLYCDRGPEDGAAAGICMVLEGDNCVFDGMIYRNGETFQPSCKYQCTCRDGQIGCLPRCNLDLLLPGPDCPFPRKVEVPGECCEKWVCDPDDEVILGGFAMAAYRQEATLGIVSDSSANCIEQTTEWSACSKSCGMGFSTRVTNRNQQCEMVKQTRLCMIRPCENEESSDKKGKKCIRTRKSVRAVRYEYRNCSSVQTYRPRYCGLCSDGRCCTPHGTKTIQVEFRCPQGKVLKKPMMFINTCVCHNNCPQSNVVFLQPSDPTSSEAKL
ncbi:NOV protein, partial [Chloropsis hardwickii]|nr:NOV protein [Chloropsis hardwickii]